MPLDKTPLGDEMAESMPERKFPQPKQEPTQEPKPESAQEQALDISNRPPLPSPTTADVEDEDADPVIDTGPGISDGPQRSTEEKRMTMPDVPAPEPVPPMNNPDPQPGDPKPKVPPPEESGRKVVPVELPGKPHAPERV